MTVSNATATASTLEALAGIGHNQPPVAKYTATTTDAESLKVALGKALLGIEGGARTLESKSLPYTVGAADWLMMGGGSWVQTAAEWPADKPTPDKFPAYNPEPVRGTTAERRAAVEKFLEESGAKPGKDNSAYTRNSAAMAVKVAVMITDDSYPVYLGYKLKSPGKRPDGSRSNEYTKTYPGDGVACERHLVAPHRVAVPSIQSGRDWVPNENETIVPITFHKGAEIYGRLVKGQRGTKAKSTTAVNDTIGAAIAAAGPAGVLAGLTEVMTAKDFIPKPADFTAPLNLAHEIVTRLNSRYPDAFPADVLLALVNLKNEIEERIQTMPDGVTYRTIPSSGNGEGIALHFDKIVEQARAA